MKMYHSLKIESSWLLLPLVFLFGACERVEEDGVADAAGDAEMHNVDDTMDAGTAITAVTDNYVQHYNLGHADVVAAMYTPDAVFLGADGSVSQGSAAIQAYLTGQIAEGSPKLQARVIDEKVFGDTAIVVGSYSVASTPEGAEPVQISGHWMAAEVQAPDGWKIAGLITNHDRQMSAEFLQGAAGEMPPEESALGELLNAYTTAWNAGDVAAIADLYTENAWAAFADLPPVTGREAIASLNEERVAGTLALHGVKSADLGGGYTVDGGWYEISGAGVEGGPIRGNYWILVNTGDDGARKIEWLVSNGRPVSVIPEAGAM